MVVRLTQEDRDRLSAAVATAEGQTSAEIVLAVNQACDDYSGPSLLWAAAAGFVFAGGLALLFPDMHIRVAFALTGAVALLAALVLHLPDVRLALAPKDAKREHAARAARTHFATHVAGRTAGSNGLLIFVALAERYVEIIPEAGIARAIPEATWTNIVAELLAEVGRGNLVGGLADAVTKSATVLTPVFPHRPDDKDELPNGIIFNER